MSRPALENYAIEAKTIASTNIAVATEPKVDVLDIHKLFTPVLQKLMGLIIKFLYICAMRISSIG